MDLNTIQDKLTRQVDALSHSHPAIQTDWPQPQLPNMPGRGSSSLAELSATVETLKRRSVQSYQAGSPVPRSQQGQSSGGHPSLNPQVPLRRMVAMVDKINHLSLEQERAMAEIHGLRSQLVQSSARWAEVGEAGAQIPTLQTNHAVTACAELDPQGNILLSYRTVSLAQAEAEAQYLAAHLRGTYGTPAPRRGTAAMGLGFSMLWQEPLELLSQGWTMVRRWLYSYRFAPASQATRPPRRATMTGLSAIDALLWVGGGVIGRLALNLAVAAVPALWFLAVVAITAVTAYAVYRATLARHLEFGLALRVFLAIAGLMIGGQLI